MNFNWLMRMSRWARNPPSEKRVKYMLLIVAACLTLWAIEQFFGWPEALTPNQVRPRPIGIN
ncbi:MAG: hypothetical protein QNI90_10160 [Dinoroseobacter sp.]|nr:hypothetical protein [Dinoroseobacter sp.]MDJ0993927.1 hypothetical protein [Dinoroseobacter sp.]